jgi:hypothetical protein
LGKTNNKELNESYPREFKDTWLTKCDGVWGLVVALVLVSANIAAFFYGEYHTLKPILFPLGLFVASVATVWVSLRTWFRTFTVLVLVTISVAFVDEYAHTASKIFTYFDGYTPSPLTVFGWGLFVILIIALARILYNYISLKESVALRLTPALLSILFLSILVYILGYLPIMSPLLIIVYLVLGAASIYYTYTHPAGWNWSLMIMSMVFGSGMEYIGSIEGLWSFHFGEPICLFMVFTWALRVWTILAICSIMGKDLTPYPK